MRELLTRRVQQSVAVDVLVGGAFRQTLLVTRPAEGKGGCVNLYSGVEVGGGKDGYGDFTLALGVDSVGVAAGFDVDV